MTLRTEARDASLTDLRDLLVEQHARKIDVVAPASKIRSTEGDIVVAGTNPILSENGVTAADGTYRPTSVFDEGLADKFGIPLAYVRRLRAERPDLMDANVNGWLHGRCAKMRMPSIDEVRTGRTDPVEVRPAVPGDERSFLIRAFRGDDQENGIARAFLSDRYSVMDNLDALTAALDGVAQAGAPIDIEGCDLTDRRMYVRIKSPAVTAMAPTLLERYRSPFSGDRGADNPTVFAGFVISNSETGGGAFSIVPRIVIQVCSNGMTITKDAMRSVHLGGRMDEGVIRWSQDTEEKNLGLITAKARDAVATFLDVDYLTKVIRDIEEKAGKKIVNPQEDVLTVTKRLAFDEATRDSVFRMFIEGGDLTAGGVMQAVTAAARETVDADKAHDMEAQALRALEFAAAL